MGMPAKTAHGNDTCHGPTLVLFNFADFQQRRESEKRKEPSQAMRIQDLGLSCARQNAKRKWPGLFHSFYTNWMHEQVMSRSADQTRGAQTTRTAAHCPVPAVPMRHSFPNLCRCRCGWRMGGTDHGGSLGAKHSQLTGHPRNLPGLLAPFHNATVRHPKGHLV